MFVPMNAPGSPLVSRAQIRRLAAAFPLPVSGIGASGRACMMAYLAQRPPAGAVWVPAYFCRSVTEPLRHAGIPFRLYDVDARLAPVPESISRGPGDLALLVHFFGLLQPIEPLLQAGFSVDEIVEDGAHTLPDPEAAAPAGTRAAAAFFSLRKMLPVPYGGFLVGGNPVTRLDGADQAPVSVKKRALMAAEWLACGINANPLAIKDRLRSALGSTDSPSLSGTTSPVLEPAPAHQADSNLFTAIAKRRRAHYDMLVDRIGGCRGVEVPFPSQPAGSCPMGLPVLVDDPVSFTRACRGRGIDACRWPGLEAMDLPRNGFPGAEGWQRQLVLLPVTHGLSDTRLRAAGVAIKQASGARNELAGSGIEPEAIRAAPEHFPRAVRSGEPTHRRLASPGPS